MQLSKDATICADVWQRVVLAAHDSFTGGSLLPFHKRKAVENEKKKRKKKEKKQKLKSKMKKKKIEERIRQEVYKEIAEKEAGKRILENTTTQIPNVSFVQNNANVVQNANVLILKRKTPDIVGVNTVENRNLRKRLKAQDCSCVTIRAFLKYR